MKHLMSAAIISLVAFAALADTSSPYAGEQAREIKALSPQQIEGYLSGDGMGYAKAAELNRYPGPRHVLDLADELELTPAQRRQTQAIFEAMKDRAEALGVQVVDKERALDRQFASGEIDPTHLRTLLSDIGALEAQIRYTHLAAHLEQKALLSPHQVRMYDRLRGYGTGHGRGGHHGH